MLSCNGSSKLTQLFWDKIFLKSVPGDLESKLTNDEICGAGQMKKILPFLFVGLLLVVDTGDLSASARGICRGFGGGRVHLHLHAGPRYNRRGDDLVFLLMLSSTSTSIYCISIADEDDSWNRSPRRRYSMINYERLKEEGARGRGEYIAALSFYMGCPADVTEEFAASVQANYQGLFRPPVEFKIDPFLERLGQIISDNPKLSRSCTAATSENSHL